MRNLTSFYNLLKILIFFITVTKKLGKPVLQVATLEQSRESPKIDKLDTRVTTEKSVVQVDQYK